MKKLMIASITVAAVMTSTPSFSADAPAKIAQCVGCHGANGNSVVPTFPKLAGQHSAYLAKQLKDFRDGYRQDAMMAGFAKGLSDQEIQAISDYYAAQKPM
jgi:cytochrome c553